MCVILLCRRCTTARRLLHRRLCSRHSGRPLPLPLHTNRPSHGSPQPPSRRQMQKRAAATSRAFLAPLLGCRSARGMPLGGSNSYVSQPHLPLHGVLLLVLLVLLAAARRRQRRRSSCPGQMPWAREATTAWRSNHPPITTRRCLAGRGPARRCAQPGMAQSLSMVTLKAKMQQAVWP